LASEVVEYVYAQSSESERKEMVFSFYGSYFLLLKEHKTGFSLKDFLEEKPNLRETILTKLEKVAMKLVEKGLTRHTLVQAIVKDYIE